MATLKDSTYVAGTPFTISLASLANSTAGVGRQSTEVDNTTTKFVGIWVSALIKMGTTPTANTAVYLYLIRNDNASTPIRDDGAGASDAAITIVNAPLIGTLTCSTTTTGADLRGVFWVPDVGPKFSIAVVNSTAVALNSTGGNHVINYVGRTYDIA